MGISDAPESLSIAVRVLLWTGVLCCHARRPSCSTSSGASEIPQQPFLIKFDDTFRLMLQNFAWEKLAWHRRGLAGVLQRLQCGVVARCDWITLPTPSELLPDNSPKFPKAESASLINVDIPWNWNIFGTDQLRRCTIHLRVGRRDTEGLGFLLTHHLPSVSMEPDSNREM